MTGKEAKVVKAARARIEAASLPTWFAYLDASDAHDWPEAKQLFERYVEAIRAIVDWGKRQRDATYAEQMAALGEQA